MKEERTKKDEYQKALAVYGEAMKDIRKERFDKALESLRAFVEKFGAERELADRAKMYIALCEERLKTDKSAVSLKSGDDYYHFGVFKMNAGDLEEGKKLLEKAQKMNPEDGKVSFALADLAVLTNQPDESLEHLKRAIQLDKSFRILAQNEPDFEPLWDDKKFKIITRIV